MAEPCKHMIIPIERIASWLKYSRKTYTVLVCLLCYREIKSLAE